MYKEWISRQTHGIIKNDSYEAEPLEVKLRKATEEKKPIEAIAPMIYTEKSKGVIPEYDIRTDRFEIAQAAMEKLNSVKFAEAAKTEEIMGGASDLFNKIVFGERLYFYNKKVYFRFFYKKSRKKQTN